MRKITPMHLARVSVNYTRARDKRRALCVEAIRDHGMTYRRVSVLTGVPVSQLHRWVKDAELDTLPHPIDED